MHGTRFTPDAHRALARVDARIVAPWLSEEAVFARLVDATMTISVDAELEKLCAPNVNGLGGADHRRLLKELMHAAQVIFTVN